MRIIPACSHLTVLCAELKWLDARSNFYFQKNNSNNSVYLTIMKNNAVLYDQHLGMECKGRFQPTNEPHSNNVKRFVFKATKPNIQHVITLKNPRLFLKSPHFIFPQRLLKAQRAFLLSTALMYLENYCFDYRYFKCFLFGKPICILDELRGPQTNQPWTKHANFEKRFIKIEITLLNAKNVLDVCSSSVCRLFYLFQSYFQVVIYETNSQFDFNKIHT